MSAPRSDNDQEESCDAEDDDQQVSVAQPACGEVLIEFVRAGRQSCQLLVAQRRDCLPR